MDSLPITIPPAPTPPGRTPLPILAALVPVIGGIVLWLVTGSILSLCFAALGPLMLVAGAIDGTRSRWSARRRAEAEEDAGWLRAEDELRERHEAERMLRRHRDPDVVTALSDPPLRDGRQLDAETSIVVGSGTRPSTLRAGGGEGERAREFRVRCARIQDVPVAVQLGYGVALRGGSTLTAAAARALVLQLCLRFGASQLVLVGSAVERLGLAALPHARAVGRAGFRLAVVEHGETLDTSAEAALWVLPSAETVPQGIACVIDIEEVQQATVRTPDGVVQIRPEFVSRAQVRSAARELDDEETTAASVIPDRVLLSDLAQNARASSLAATLGRSERDAVVLDLVEDGPHAIVTGTTGSGKSELLVSWVAALASAYGPDRVVFVLADFKGGTAFEALRALPHVVAVVTDLDPAGARRGVSSLSAELRRRETVLAEHGARDIAEVDMPRLVIVVDEFAALLQEHSDLASVFTDIAARGRALGMHLVLGTQRAVGVVRDALAANCPLRVCLRVGDPADSRAVIGSDDAAQITGGPEARGLALARRPRDDNARALRVALTQADDLERIGERWSASPPPRSPWLPPLPTVLALADLRREAPGGTIVLGRADLPERQEQPLELLRVGSDRGIAVIGQSGSGRSSALRAIAVQCPGVVEVPIDPESAWDVVSALATAPPSGRPELILCDDLDAQLEALPAEHAAHLAQLWERIIRGRPEATIVLAATRSSGASGRILDLLPRRAVLRTGGRTEHLAAGGDPEGYVRDRPAGRARIGDHDVQLAWTPEQRLRSSRARGDRTSTSSWRPSAAVTAVVSAGANQAIADLASMFPDCAVVAPADVGSVDRKPRTILVADAETWQREWSLWQRARADGEILVRSENPTDLRQLAAVRELPPYARPHAGRAWAVRGSESPRRVVVDAWRPRR
ncbi:FtsK/SpoIIIE domain-containing protein [Microbacterium sp. NPDC089696]|uniref:FtsK/SpoIIIE domain-containing protein n=1 Tax=Microbacterium sp. NPDC089696 TaxID=3364199 RepID=UPI00381D99E8